jgi:hypothetical protein
VSRPSLAICAFVGVVVAACSSSSAPAGLVGCSGGFLGSPSDPLTFEFLVGNAASEVVALNDGDSVPLTIPPQGGQVVFIGVRATNLDSCGVQLTGALRDEASQQVRFDQRTVNLIPGGDGWGSTGPIGMPISGTASNFANIPACPNEWSSSDVDGHAYALEVTVQDAGGRTLEQTIHVTPVCEASDLANCECICARGYVLGGACTAPEDAGTDAP